MKRLQQIEHAIAESRKLFNDLNAIRDRGQQARMQKKAMNVMSSLLILKDELLKFENKLSKLEKIEEILSK